MKTIYFAGGCFWGVEKYFSLAKGVDKTEAGYANGSKENPSYIDLKSGLDDASETVKKVENSTFGSFIFHFACQGILTNRKSAFHFIP